MVQLQLVVVCPFLQASVERKTLNLAKENELIAVGYCKFGNAATPRAPQARQKRMKTNFGCY